MKKKAVVSIVSLVLAIFLITSAILSVEFVKNFTNPYWHDYIIKEWVKLVSCLLSLVVLVSFNLFVWFWHKIPTPEEQARMKEERKAKKLAKLQQKVEKMKNE